MLINWMFFWDTNDWTPGSVSATATPTVVVDMGSGGGHWYDHEYWDIREEHIRRHLPREFEQQKPEKVDAPEKPVREPVEAEIVMPVKADIGPLQEAMNKMRLQIENYELESEDDAILALIL